MPPSAAAWIAVFLVASAKTRCPRTLVDVQVAPLSVVRKMPSRRLPAYAAPDCAGSYANASMPETRKLELGPVHVAPESPVRTSGEPPSELCQALTTGKSAELVLPAMCARPPPSTAMPPRKSLPTPPMRVAYTRAPAVSNFATNMVPRVDDPICAEAGKSQESVLPAT